MKENQFKKELEISKEIAVRAGKKIIEIYNQPDFFVKTKEDENGRKSPLTEADLAADMIITTALKKSFPEDGFLTEEKADNLERLNKNRVWIIDPLDGTKEFIKRNGEFTVNIALIEEGRPILGVIYVPVTEELYFASKDNGAFLEKDSKVERIHVSEINSIRLMKLVKSRSHAKEQLQNIIKSNHFAEVISTGSSLKGCLIAKGEAEIYFRFGPTSEWDICAMNCIVEEAKGIMTDLNGRLLRYNQEDVRNKGFVISNNTIHKKLVEMSKRTFEK